MKKNIIIHIKFHTLYELNYLWQFGFTNFFKMKSFSFLTIKSESFGMSLSLKESPPTSECTTAGKEKSREKEREGERERDGKTVGWKKREKERKRETVI